MVIAAGRDEGRLVAVAQLQLEAEHAAVEVEGAVEIGDLEVNVADVDVRIDGAWLHTAILSRADRGTQEPRSALYLGEAI